MSITLRAKRILTGALAGALVLGLLPAGVASANTDVCDGASSAGFADTNGTFQSDIDCAVGHGIVTGQAGNVFNASSNMTRGQMATALVNFVATAKNVAVSTLPTGAHTFEDVAGTTHEDNIARAFAMGIIKGRDATTFDPGSRITRAAAATMIANAHVSADALGMDLSGVTPYTNFTDLGSSVHAPNINVLAAAGVITGVDTAGTTFAPNRSVTRGQVAAMVIRAANLVVAPNGLWNAPALSTPVIAGNVVTERPGGAIAAGGEFKYSTGSEIVTVKLGENDVYIIDGFTATVETFNTDLSVGDVVVVEKDTPATGRQTIRLTNRTAADYTTGITGGLDANDNKLITIIEPVSGLVLRGGTDVTGDEVIDITASLSTYTVDGASATLAQFRDNINTGDIIAISGAGTTANPYVFALTNRTVAGTVEARNAGANTITVKSSIGFLTEEFEITNTADTVLTLDGTTVSPSSGNQAAFTEAAVRPGDSVVVGKAGGVLSVSVTRVASAAVSGIVGGDDVDRDTTNSGTDGAAPADATDKLVFTPATGTTPKLSGQAIDAYNLVVDGSTVSPAVFISQLTVGDAVTVLERDEQLRPKGTITLTNQALSGPVRDVAVADDQFTVQLNSPTIAAADRVTTANIEYKEQFFGGTADDPTYSVNGSTVLVGAFETALELIQEGTRTGTIVISRVGDATNYALTTAAASAATVNSVTVQDGEGDTPTGAGNTDAERVVLTFSQPVRFNAALAAGDFVITRTDDDGAVTTIAFDNDDWSVSPISPDGHLKDLIVTFTDLTVAEKDVIKVELTAQGAAKVLDKNGTAAVAGTKSAGAIA